MLSAKKTTSSSGKSLGIITTSPSAGKYFVYSGAGKKDLAPKGIKGEGLNPSPERRG